MKTLNASMFTPDIMECIEDMVQEIMHTRAYFSKSEFTLKRICLYGSVKNGTATEISDIDILVEYEGTAREDTVFDVLHEEEPVLFDKILDFNPIKAEKSGTIEDYLKRCSDYKKENGEG